MYSFSRYKNEVVCHYKVRRNDWMTVLNGTVLSYRQLRHCNSTMLLTSSRSSVYALGFMLASPQASRHRDPDSYDSEQEDDFDYQPAPNSAPASFTIACPARFSAQPGQRVRVAVYSFGARLQVDASTTSRDQPDDGHLSPKAFVGAPPTVVELPPSSCPVSVNVREGRDATPQYDNDVCRPQRHRQRHLYTTNGTSVELFITGVDVDHQHGRQQTVEFHQWNFILKLEGKFSVIS